MGGCNGNNKEVEPIPDGILAVMQKPRYADATWCLRVIDFETGEAIYDLNPNLLAFTGSVRKTYSVGLALNELGSDHTFKTPIYRQGDITEGVLAGDLILVADGDLTMGGRNTPQGTVAFTSFDHTEANSLGSAILTEPDPLQGIDELAAEVAASGITVVDGDVIVDDRLFDLFRVPNGNVLITPMLINDNLVDITIIPTEPGQPAIVDWRPKSAAFGVEANVTTGPADGQLQLTFTGSEIPGCIGTPGCKGTVTGQIPAGYKPALPGVDTLVRTLSIQDPASYARIVLIEALERAGVEVTAETIAVNPAEKLPPQNSYAADDKVAEFVSLPYSEYSKLILKVSHNLGANLSLMLFGLTQGARTIDTALAAERETLINDFGINGSDFNFPTNGSGSPDSQATPSATVKLLREMGSRDVFASYFNSFPILGVDGSLAAVGVDPPNPVIEPAIGRVYAKTGTTVLGTFFKAQVFAGYIDAKSGRRLVYALYVNDIGELESIAEAIEVFNDEGEISAIIYDLN